MRSNILASITIASCWFTERLFSNRWLWATIVLVTSLTLLVMLTPAMQSLFKLTALTATQWWIVVGLSIGVLVLSEFCKLFVRNNKQF
ncbi:MAG: cation transporting ATPase C-terminal domain-containing protein [Alistipes sp.]|nr:cation transporting ATPase C-terminal domain-containing protein [Alistipes sp.]